MKKVVFFSMPEGGHVYPSIGFCKELSAKNIHLIYYTNKKFFKALSGFNGDNVTLRAYPDEIMAYVDENTADPEFINNFTKILFILFYLTENLLPFLDEEVKKEKPDLVICDHLAIWSRILVKVRNLPFVVFFPNVIKEKDPGPAFKQFESSVLKMCLLNLNVLFKIIGMIIRIKRKYGYVLFNVDDLFDSKDSFNIVLTSRYFQPQEKSYGDNYKFAGPSLLASIGEIKKENVIFISRGSTTIDREIWKICFKALGNLDYKVIISFGGTEMIEFEPGEVPANFQIVKNFPLDEYIEVLKKAKIYVSHGGMNSIQDAVTFLTPQLLIPQDLPEYYYGSRAKDLQIAEVIRREKITAENLRETILRIINDSKYMEGLKKCRESYFNTMGLKGAVDELNKSFSLY